MSVRASLISFFLRRTVKKTMSNFVEPISLRARFSSSPKKLSAEVMSERVESGGVSGSWLWKKNADTSKIVLYLHGGGYVFGGYGSHGEIASEMADIVGGRALLLEYRLAPEHPFPALASCKFARHGALEYHCCASWSNLTISFGHSLRAACLLT